MSCRANGWVRLNWVGALLAQAQGEKHALAGHYQVLKLSYLVCLYGAALSRVSLDSLQGVAYAIFICSCRSVLTTFARIARSLPSCPVYWLGMRVREKDPRVVD